MLNSGRGTGVWPMVRLRWAWIGYIGWGRRKPAGEMGWLTWLAPPGERLAGW